MKWRGCLDGVADGFPLLSLRTDRSGGPSGVDADAGIGAWKHRVGGVGCGCRVDGWDGPRFASRCSIGDAERPPAQVVRFGGGVDRRLLPRFTDAPWSVAPDGVLRWCGSRFEPGLRNVATVRPCGYGPSGPDSAHGFDLAVTRGANAWARSRGEGEPLVRHQYPRCSCRECLLRPMRCSRSSGSAVP